MGRAMGYRSLWRGDDGSAEVRLAVRSAAQWTGALKGPAFFAYADNYLIDVRNGVIVPPGRAGLDRHEVQKE